MKTIKVDNRWWRVCPACGRLVALTKMAEWGICLCCEERVDRSTANLQAPAWGPKKEK